MGDEDDIHAIPSVFEMPPTALGLVWSLLGYRATTTLRQLR